MIPAAGIPDRTAPITVRQRLYSLSKRLLRRPAFVAGMLCLSLLIIIAVLAPLLAPHDPMQQDLALSLRPPMWDRGGAPDHPLGTDMLGRDLLSRMMYGARNSLTIALFAVTLSATLGTLAGLVAGFYGGWRDSLIMRFGDMQLAFPFILLAITVLGVLSDRTVVHLILILGIPGWILYARVVRARVLSERGKDYVTAASAIGASRLRQMRRYVLPSIWQSVLVIAMLDFGFIILVEATLSFLGFGLTPPTPSWGGILAEGRRNITIAPWLSILPGVAIMLTVLSINLTADGAADILDPKLRRSTFRRIRQTLAGRPLQAGSELLSGRSASAAGPTDFLDVRELSVSFPLEGRVVHAVRQVSFSLQRGQALGIVGESGSGKSVTASAIIQLIDAPGRVTHGEILFEGRDLSRLSNQEMARLRGTAIGMIFQNPATSLNPVLSIGAQMIETLRVHRPLSTDEAHSIAEGALLDVGIGDPRGVMARFPFQLSGGMNQRVMIALAMLSQPELLIADEPTTALDVTTQAQILEQLRDLMCKRQTALILITHDIALVSEYADQVVVLYAGQVCESGPVTDVIHAPLHPYTRALLDSMPRTDLASDQRLRTIPGELPAASAILPGCPFAPRCVHAIDICTRVNPPLRSIGNNRQSACHLNDTQEEIP